MNRIVLLSANWFFLKCVLDTKNANLIPLPKYFCCSPKFFLLRLRKKWTKLYFFPVKWFFSGQCREHQPMQFRQLCGNDFGKVRGFFGWKRKIDRKFISFFKGNFFQQKVPLDTEKAVLTFLLKFFCRSQIFLLLKVQKDEHNCKHSRYMVFLQSVCWKRAMQFW